jgi:hypothetical protein
VDVVIQRHCRRNPLARLVVGAARVTRPGTGLTPVGVDLRRALDAVEGLTVDGALRWGFALSSASGVLWPWPELAAGVAEAYRAATGMHVVVLFEDLRLPAGPARAGLYAFTGGGWDGGGRGRRPGVNR